MDLDLASLPRIAEGKTKIVYANPDDSDTVYLYFKDDITAGDGAQHDVLRGKAILDWRVSRDCFEHLVRAGFHTHYLLSPVERVALVRRLEHRIELEVVSRRVATGSIVQRRLAEEGTRFDPVLTQFHYKDDFLHDPMLDDGYVDYLIAAKGSEEYATMREMNAAIHACLEDAFARFAMQLVDLKLEFGIVDGQVCLIDEISAGSFRLWPYRTSAPDLSRANVLDQLDSEARLDKDTYRMGQGVDRILGGFAAVARITKVFRELR